MNDASAAIGYKHGEATANTSMNAKLEEGVSCDVAEEQTKRKTKTKKTKKKKKKNKAADTAERPPQSADEWLFCRLSDAIFKGDAAGGALYKSGKHVIFSNPNRNQAPISLCNYLLRLGCIEAASAISALISHTEAKYNKHVAAVQINVHLDGKSCHKQVRVYAVNHFSVWVHA